jgi:integrase
MATVFRRKKGGLWIAAWKDESGTWRHKTGTASKDDTLRMGRRLEREAKAKSLRRIGSDPFEQHKEAPISEHVDAYVATLQRRQRSSDYVSQIRAILLRVIEAAAIKSIGEIDVVRIGDAIDGLPRQQGKYAKSSPAAGEASLRTKATYASRMRSFARWLVKAQRLRSNPLEALEFQDDHGQSPAKRKRRALSRPEASKLLAAAESRPLNELLTSRRGKNRGALAATCRSDRAVERARLRGKARKTIYMLALWTGLRRNEIKQLRWGDLKLEGDRPSIDLRAATAKSRKAARIPVHEELRQALHEWREAQAEPPSASSSLFPSLPDMKAFRADLALAGIRFEVPGRGVVDFHALRKTFGTWLAAGGIPRRLRQAAMRHASPELTETTYMDEDELPVFEHLSAMPTIASGE